MIDKVDVAVLGAGLAGSTLAKMLADMGWSVSLIDRQQFPRHKVCGEFLSPESLQSLEECGLLQLVESLGPRTITEAYLVESGGSSVRIPLPGRAIGISRYCLDAALHEAAVKSGAQVYTASTVTGIHAPPVHPAHSTQGHGYTIEVRRHGHNFKLEARAVIAAWGAGRRVPVTGAGWRGGADLIGQPGTTVRAASRSAGAEPVYSANRRLPAAGGTAHVGVKSHFTGIGMGSSVELYFVPGGYVGLAPVEGGIVNAAALLPRELVRGTDSSVAGIIAAAARMNPKLQQRLEPAAPVAGSQAAVAPVDLQRGLTAWDVIPQVGDATVMIPPLCGDGMSMALRSAALCAPLANSYLLGEIGLALWEERYTAALQREFNSPLRWGRLLQAALGVSWMPRAVMGLAQLSPALAAGLIQATRLKPER
ncbi:NAD(P)/FAD-dependent oxidoreductase [Paenibacillus sp. FJAT-26967]|uniref:NAD(P)/FAD-dependent oxidoreductase n=1 Tax=Paenibacillus sp. FJAT-26967 TaxID=1729690 RepID=UPI0008390E09|nr:FAD-dependent monooxygenase [Paenibacillus sp. FJAT-26967]